MSRLKNLDGLILPKIKKNCTHSFYALPLIIDKTKVKVDREKLIKKLKKEKINCFSSGYLNVHTFPMFKKKIAYGKNLPKDLLCSYHPCYLDGCMSW